MPIGFDCGTYNLIAARRGEDKKEVKYRKEVNAFLEISLDDPFTFNMMKRSGVPLIEREKVGYLVGEAAIKTAFSLRKLELRRPMKAGCLNQTERDAFGILKVMIHSLMGEVEKDKDVLYYSVPANAVNEHTDADYHQKVLEEIFRKYKVKDKTVVPYPINEGQALVFAELQDKNFTGIGCSFGAGMVNFSYCVFSRNIFSFATTVSGDWIDHQASQAANEGVAVINRTKHTIDLTKAPTSPTERAIQTQYRIMIEKNVKLIKQALEQNSGEVRADEPVDIVLGGGTCSPPGFDQMFAEAVKAAGLPLPIGEIKRPPDHLYCVARGCLVAAENV